MANQVFDLENIINRLKFFNYKYELKGKKLKIYLPMLCFLIIESQDNKIKMASRVAFGFRNLPIGFNFFIYGMALYLLAWFEWTSLNKGIFILGGFMMILFVVCFIKIELMRSTVHNWIENDSINSINK